MIVGVEERRHGPSDAMHNPSQPFEFLLKETCLIFHKHRTFKSGYLRITLTKWEILPESTFNSIAVGDLQDSIELKRVLTDAPVTRTASTAVKPCQEDSYEFYLITDNLNVGVATFSEVGFIDTCSYSSFQSQSFSIKILDTKLPHHQSASKSNKE
ncbi:hypothetical protein Tco_0771843 [Tanacetum coccineum]|uniref:Uncharacterized protein n=1 Tax=Tanacetum coccineum TaxID=301880 RepID=A0ABQ4ZHA5_9ASTR